MLTSYKSIVFVMPLAITCFGGVFRSEPPGAETTIAVERPLVLIFGPSSEGVVDEHLFFGLEDLSQCLKPTGEEVRLVTDNRIRLVDGSRTYEFVRSCDLTRETGCYFIAPGRTPETKEVMPSGVSLVCRAYATKYFGRPACCPEGFACENGELLLQ